VAQQDVREVLPYTVNFSIVVVILVALLRKPLRKFLYQRHERMKDAFECAGLAFKRSQDRHAAAKKAIEQLAQEESRLASEMKQVTEQERSAILTKANEEASRIRAEVERLIQVEQDEANERVKTQFVDLVVKNTEEALQKSLKKDDHSAILKRAQTSIEVGV